MLFCTTPFVQMARALVTAAGVPELRIVEASHPLGGLREVDVLAQVRTVAADVLTLLGLD